MIHELSKSQKRTIMCLLTALFFVGVSATDIYIASLPQMVHDFHSSPGVVNLTLSCYSFGLALAVLFVGEFSSRFGRRRVLLCGVLGFALSALLIAVLPDLFIIIGLRVVQAVCGAVIIIVPRLILKDCMDEREQIKANGTLLMGLIISPAVAPVVGAYLAHLWGWESCFLFTGILGIILWLLMLRLLPETLGTRILRFAKPKQYLRIYFQLLGSRIFMVFTTIYATALAAYFSFIGISSYLYIDYWQIPPRAYSWLYLWLSGAYLLGNQIMQLLNRRRVSSATIIGVGVYFTLFGALLTIGAGIVNQSIALVVVTCGVFCMRAANALINPPSQIRIMSHFNPVSAQAIGLNTCIGFIMSGVAINLVTLFVSTPLEGLLLISSSFVFVCFIIYRFNCNLMG